MRTLNRVNILAAAIALALPVAAAAGPAYTDWGDPVPANDTDNSVQGGCPFESRDGHSIYMATPRAGGQGALDIWRAWRPSVEEPFGPAENLPAPVNSNADDFCPTSIGGNYLFFVSRRGGEDACGGGDIFLTRDNPAHGWQEPVRLGCADLGEGPNSAGEEFSPSYIETPAGAFLYYSSTGSGNHDIYVSELGPDGFGPGVPVDGLNTEFDDRMPNVSKDGLEVVFSSDRAEPGNQDVYMATRDSIHDAWSAPVQLHEGINTPAGETRASMSWDRTRLYFGRSGEIYVSEREKARGGN
ncbi:hypothetical protein F3N42_03560 [Marinihelvus fidelis]|uniref:Family 43 glycosylhydrolase n=1 Tax=Marinihelvus fidelis TaxID=2613842 RepID=A0A5N0TJE8_9GAMM|nr:PD40 domain-containing protein [Marinihelvus fidelis]KAA9133439.1 hypothetical protein F3N42_03560 [Marinihelvus fidelis]